MLTSSRTVAETLSIGDETVIIPTIVMGSPMTLANSDGNDNLKASAGNAHKWCSSWCQSRYTWIHTNGA